jgi:hypothetical protein
MDGRDSATALLRAIVYADTREAQAHAIRRAVLVHAMRRGGEVADWPCVIQGHITASRKRGGPCVRVPMPTLRAMSGSAYEAVQRVFG